MKYANLIIVMLLLTVTLLCSCSQNEILIDKQDIPLQFTLNVDGITPVTRSVDENLDMPVYIIVYKAGENDNTTPTLFIKEELKNGQSSFIYPPDKTFDRNLMYDIYVIGKNDETISLTANTTLGDLRSLSQSGIKEIEAKIKSCLVTGGLKNVSFTNPVKSITLVRNVCRLELEITDNTGTYKSIAASFESPNQTYAFPATINGLNGLPVGTTNEVLSFNEDGLGVLKVEHYFFEKYSQKTGLTEDDKLKLVIEAVKEEASTDRKFTYLIELNADGGFRTERNTIYRVKAGLNLTGLIIKTNSSIIWSGAFDDLQDVYPE